MSMQAEVVEISSSDDEEETQSESGRSSCRRALFVADDDEIKVIDSLSCSEKRNSRPKRAKSGIQLEDLENDCLILDGDPEKLAPDPEANDDTEDLVVTAEKGQVACRDFPHPRHLCVKLPFKSTPHEKYCEKCHCYVCDKPAPCLFWGKDNPEKDHCHSSDKEEKWKNMRNVYKMRNSNERPMALQHPFHARLSLTTRTTVPVSRSNQSNAGTVFPLQLSLGTDAMQSIMSTRSDQQRPLPNTYGRNRTPNKETSSGYRNSMSNQHSRVGQSGSRFRASDRRNPSNLGVYGQGPFSRKSHGNRYYTPDSWHRQRNHINMLLTNNNRPNILDASSTTQRHPINTHSSEQMHTHVNDMRPNSRDLACNQNYTNDDKLSKLLEFLEGGDSEESNRSQNDSSINSGLNNMTMNSNGFTRSQSSCVTSTHELQLLPQSSISAGVPNVAENAPQWSHALDMLQTSAFVNSTTTEQCPYLDFQNFNCEWLNETLYSPVRSVMEPWVQAESEVTTTSQTWNYLSAQIPATINDSVFLENMPDQSTVRHDGETAVFNAQPQQPEWTAPVAPHPDVTNPVEQMSSEQGFAASSTPIPVLCVDLNNSWETLAMRQNPNSYFECT